MKQGQETAKCDKCGTEHETRFPVAENQEEYNREMTKLPLPNVIGTDGEVRMRVPCQNKECHEKIGIPLLGKAFESN